VTQIVMEGIVGAPGIAKGSAWLYLSEDLSFERRVVDDRPAEVGRFEEALRASRSELEELADKTAQAMGDEAAGIFRAHLAMVEDEALISGVQEVIQREGRNAESALDTVVEQFAAMFETLEDPYMRERAADVRDVGRRVLRHLLGRQAVSLQDVPPDSVLVAEDLTPSDTANMNARNVRALAVEKGGATSHTAILARTLGIPALMGLSGLTQTVHTGDFLVVDAGTERRGRLFVNPPAAELADLDQRLGEQASRRKKLESLADLPAETRDGRRVILAANIGGPADVDAVLQFRGEGVGLFRTEFLFMNATRLPSEEEQYRAYRQVVERLRPNLVVFRTLDVGGDKEIGYLGIPRESNPFLGWRGLRFCLDRPDVFRPQLRAMLRASEGARIAIMFPMVSTLDEITRGRALVAELREELAREGKAIGEVQVGIMVEVPAAAAAADILAHQADFFSIGTNDLTQYTLAVDRTNERVSGLYDSLHPAVLRLVADVIQAGRKAGRWVGMCGELAGDPLAAPILLGLGLEEFSLSPPALPRVKEVLRSLTVPEAEAVAQEALGQPDAQAVRRLIRERFPLAAG